MPITKNDLINETAISCGTTKDCAKVVVEQFFDVVKDIVKAGNSLEIRGFGTFSPKTCNPRLGRNLQTGELVPLAACKSVSLKFSSEIKAAIIGSPKRATKQAAPKKSVQVREFEGIGSL
ncbi:MAG: HU family DNA-binding protein [Fibromonadaceae bacterium]|nr:HU family DNA-binding protein [Fibromonadaceae bacterium]